MTPPPLPRILFATPRFLFPLDTGGQIRSAKILRAAHGTLLHVTLMSPATPEQIHAHAEELKGVCDRFIPYAPRWRHPLVRSLGRILSLLGPWPVSVATDYSPSFRKRLREERQQGNHCAEVCDFIHLSVNHDQIPDDIPVILFTHNVEQEIFQRRMEIATAWWERWLWRNQYQKMRRLEQTMVPLFPRILTVSERDTLFFRTDPGHPDVRTIPTGVDFERLPWRPPAEPPEVVFIGSMDAHQNVEGVQWFLRDIWPHLSQRVPDARIRVIGRHPPRSLTSAHEHDPRVIFTGWVADVAKESRQGRLLAVPLRVGGGTRIKIYEAMALGLPVVSTAVGAEGLELTPGIHYLEADHPLAFADAVATLLEDRQKCLELSQAARKQVENCCGWKRAAEVLRAACTDPAAH
ncbi:MAG: glycosyltransferase [Magnetococcales bacterium]|nr:glycosyltransferase [Magnetococcales bacterium]